MLELVPGETNYNIEAQNAYFRSMQRDGETLDQTKRRFFAEMDPVKPWQLVIHQDMLYKLYGWLDKVCQDNGLCYWLTGGALIGAIRNKGIIPWDTDGDVGMMRGDFERLTELMTGDALGDEVCLGYSVRDSWMYPKIVWNSPDGKTDGPHIDIFIHDTDTFENDEKAKEFWNGHWVARRNEYKEQVRSVQSNTDKYNVMRSFISQMGYPEVGNYIIWDVTGYETKSHVPERICPVSRIFPLKRVPYGDIEVCVPNEDETYAYEEHGDIWSFPSSTNISDATRRKYADWYKEYLELPEYKWLKERGY